MSFPDDHHEDVEAIEQFASKIQALISMRRIAIRKPELKNRIVAELIDVAKTQPEAKSSAFRQLRLIMGPEIKSIAHRFGPEDARQFAQRSLPKDWKPNPNKPKRPPRITAPSEPSPPPSFSGKR